MSGAWNVIAPGPSALKVEREELLAGAPVLLVNRAILLCAKLGGDVWAVYDKPRCLEPRFVHAALGERGLEVWSGFPDAWKEVGIHVAERMPSCVAHDPLDGEHEYRAAPTILLAIEMAALRGARRFRVFGMDMRGSSRTQHFDEWVPEEDPEDSRRWGYERRIWADFLAAAARDGVKIERVSPPGDEILPSPLAPPRPGKPMPFVVAPSGKPFSEDEAA